ncbi:hypothetical protein O181_095512 [Austropuccinia psidii MF-1]|uniref:Uncharacterized protein n=1 Tax=Austropuccinia psidii MF-1 TaxID=1389203 RepID=A0A9Q3J5H8_9BASI|nr:hypothetical protein [Austropuccinia psidii MF-1]
MSTTKEHKVTETKLQNNNNRKEVGIHKEVNYPINTEDCIENKPELNEMWSLDTIKNSINTKEEDSLITHNHSNKGNTKLNLQINHFLLKKAKESQMDKNEEISEEISNRQAKQDQEALSKQKNMAELLKMEFRCFNSTRKDIECSFSTVQNINEANIDESTYENSTNSLSQIDIQQELNQQKTLHPEDKSSGEAYNNCNIENKINSRFKKLQSIRNHARNEFIKNTIHSPNILEKHLSGSEYEDEAGLFCQMEIQEEAENEHKFILTEEEFP